MSDLSRKIIRTIIFKRDGNQCAFCNITLSHKTATIDHLTPVSLGGSRGAFSNMVLCCEDCNQEKADQKLLDYLRSREVVFILNKRIRFGLKNKRPILNTLIA